MQYVILKIEVSNQIKKYTQTGPLLSFSSFMELEEVILVGSAVIDGFKLVKTCSEWKEAQAYIWKTVKKKKFKLLLLTPAHVYYQNTV